MPIQKLCEGLPPQIGLYMNYTRKLGFEDKPDLEYLRKLLREILVKRDIQVDIYFDWLLKKMKKPIPEKDYIWDEHE